MLTTIIPFDVVVAIRDLNGKFFADMKTAKLRLRRLL